MQVSEQLALLTARVTKALEQAVSAVGAAAAATTAAAAASASAASASAAAAAASAAADALDTRVDVLEASGLPRSLTQAAVANTYFTIENLGTVAAGETWWIDAVVFAGSAPSGAPTTRQATTVRLLGSVKRPTVGAAAVDYTASSDGGTLPGWSTGVRLSVSANTVLLEGRVTSNGTLHVRWRRQVVTVAI